MAYLVSNLVGLQTRLCAYIDYKVQIKVQIVYTVHTTYIYRIASTFKASKSCRKTRDKTEY